ncbi:MAG TPA: heme ABC exporter ATP-binding protein CcmA [bacterium]
MAREPAVTLTRVWKIFDTPALRDVTLDAAEGAILAVLGPNGAGKTTLLRMIAGIARPSRGEVRIGAHAAGHPVARAAVGLAGHQSFLSGRLTALENLRFYADLYGLPVERAQAALEEFGLLGHQHHQVRGLSRGTVQRLSLARAFLHEPSVVLLDEPFTGLDAPAAAGLAARLRRVRDQQRCVIMATHNVDEVRTLADTVAVLVRGRLVVLAPAADANPAWLVGIYTGTTARSDAAGLRPTGPRSVGSA